MSIRRTIFRLTRRSIRAFFGRYLALLLIVLLSVGFFSGLKISKRAMQDTADAYLDRQKMYDFRILSRNFFLQADETALERIDGIKAAEAAVGTDAMVELADFPTEPDGDAIADAAADRADDKAGSAGEAEAADRADDKAGSAGEAEAADRADDKAGSAGEAEAADRADDKAGSAGTEKKLALRVQSLQESVNLPNLTAGRMPEYASECLADRRLFSEDDIGKKLEVDTDASDKAAGFLVRTEFTIVGLGDSPMYISTERGSTTIGSGRLDGFLLVPRSAFNGAVSTEIDLALDQKEYIYSHQYDDLVDEVRDRISKLLDDRAVSAYILTRNENAGYLSFQNDTAIVSGIADIFPLFFALIGMLVCITTMTRMVGEERTQIGTLKALGMSDGQISAKYLLYSGSAALLGWLLGFFPGTYGIPLVFWFAFRTVYGFAPLRYIFSLPLALLTLGFSLAMILLSTWYVTRRGLAGQPAQLIRPKAAKKGKHILLEKIPLFWKSLSFLRKITLRNMFRYRHRLVTMLTGIGCCCALVLCGFGVRDSLVDITSLQYDDIQKYQMEVTVQSGKAQKVEEALPSSVTDFLPCSLSRATLYANDETMAMVKLYASDDPEHFAEYWNLKGRRHGASGAAFPGTDRSSSGTVEFPGTGRSASGTVEFPGTDQTVVCTKIAEKLKLSVGDMLTVQDTGMNEINVQVSGIFDNYIDNVLIIDSATYEKQVGEWKPDTLLVKAGAGRAEVAANGRHESTVINNYKDSAEKNSEDSAGGESERSAKDESGSEKAGNSEGTEKTIAEELQTIEGVTTVSVLSDARQTADKALACVHYIILLLVLFSGALEFLVIYNLTSINLEERSREIATVKVLGFYPKETNSYVLRENLVLSIIASFIGLPLGALFHYAVMSRIIVSNMVFDIHIAPASYFCAVLITIFFAAVVNFFMRRYIRKLPMAESLKAVE